MREEGNYTVQTNVGFVKSTFRGILGEASVNVLSLVDLTVADPSPAILQASGSRSNPNHHPHHPHRRPLRLRLHLARRLVRLSAY